MALSQTEGNGLSSVARLSNRAKMPVRIAREFGRNLAGSLGSMNANHGPTHYRSEYGLW